MSKAEQLLEAQVKHQLALLTDDKLAATLNAELDAAYTHLREITLDSLLNADDIVDAVQRLVVEGAVPSELGALIKEIDTRLYDHAKSSGTTVGDVLPKEFIDRVTSQIESHKELRTKAIQHLVNSSIYSKLITNVLYSSLKDFVTENPLTKKLPGASRLMALGKSIGLEDNMDGILTDFIGKQVKKSIKRSEAFLVDGVNPQMMEKVKDEIWEQLSSLTLADLRDMARSQDLQTTVESATEAWDSVRRSKAFITQVRVAVGAFFGLYGGRDLQTLLMSFGVSREIFTAEGVNLLTPSLKKAVSNGYLEQRIRANLETFYKSSSVAAILGE